MLTFTLLVIFLPAYGAVVFAAGRYLARKEADKRTVATLEDAERIAPPVPVVMLPSPAAADAEISPEPVVTLIPVIMVGEEMQQQPVTDADHAAWIEQSQGLVGRDAPINTSSNAAMETALAAWIEESGGHAGYDAPF